MTEFASGKTECVSREQMDLLMHEIKACRQTIWDKPDSTMYTLIIFKIVFLLFVIFGMFVCCCLSLCVCNKQR